MREIEVLVKYFSDYYGRKHPKTLKMYKNLINLVFFIVFIILEKEK